MPNLAQLISNLRLKMPGSNSSGFVLAGELIVFKGDREVFFTLATIASQD
jgi:hypothetical protein